MFYIYRKLALLLVIPVSFNCLPDTLNKNGKFIEKLVEMSMLLYPERFHSPWHASFDCAVKQFSEFEEV